MLLGSRSDGHRKPHPLGRHEAKKKAVDLAWLQASLKVQVCLLVLGSLGVGLEVREPTERDHKSHLPALPRWGSNSPLIGPPSQPPNPLPGSPHSRYRWLSKL